MTIQSCNCSKQYHCNKPRSQAYPIFSVLRFPLMNAEERPGSSASVYYCQRKPKNRKNGVGLGTRLTNNSIHALNCMITYYYNDNNKSNQSQSILLLTLPYTALLTMVPLHSNSLGKHKFCTLVLCAKLSTSAWVPVSPSGFTLSHSHVSDELALMPSAS